MTNLSLRIALVAISLMLLVEVVVNSRNTSIAKTNIEQLEKQVDSLQNELFIQKTIVGRYELSLEHLKEIDNNTYLDVKTYLESQTE